MSESLNLILDRWIPVVDTSGTSRLIAPWEMADPALVAPNWPRPDLNTACLELLIGLVRLADPPAHADDWEDRQSPEPSRLRERLVSLAPAFDLMGNGPRFMQELGGLDGEERPPDTLFIDSGGEGGALTVREGRYPDLDYPMAAMAIYAMQTQAPSGGRGNLTSLRGGGPMTVLVDPGGGIWPLIWANVPDGKAAAAGDLPWMRRTLTSQTGVQFFPHQGHPAEVFFCMPRRLWLVGHGDRVSGVIQRPSGTKYVGWRHPLTPYYRQKAGDDPLPVRPRAGVFGYRHWLGIAARHGSVLRERPEMVEAWESRGLNRRAEIVVAGWAMENMKARDYCWSRAPLVALPEDRVLFLAGMVEAAELFSRALREKLASVVREKNFSDFSQREAAREEFYVRTQGAFEGWTSQLASVDLEEAARGWLADMRVAALKIFEKLALPGLADRTIQEQQAIVLAHRDLADCFAGYGKLGKKAFGALNLSLPVKMKEEATA
jgi:CRISPR system Cascade subunit CasA